MIIPWCLWLLKACIFIIKCVQSNNKYISLSTVLSSDLSDPRQSVTRGAVHVQKEQKVGGGLGEGWGGGGEGHYMIQQEVFIQWFVPPQEFQLSLVDGSSSLPARKWE